ncbi:hypothetical protein BDV33DRAFT_100906 [Aspergillus novoparasiticus]|uniref:Cellobiose dehydrogenase-like cytochrome domain-containing protein n=1 Tax=Aspergillus novoparasiticus TaxID=986946 RepID=A0A5N6ERE0_9EURO|nr:hypothetical protein BDV33DRAFT_100906 [Aspergillus novoparasiticus]
MALRNTILTTLVAVSTLLSSCRAQAPEAVIYNDQATGITFDTWNVPSSSKAGGLTFGVALPSDALKSDATDFIGYLRCTATDKSAAEGWCGITLGGSMTDALLFVAYPDGDAVRTSLRFTSEYAMPGVYSGNATVKPISATANSTGFSLIFHCQDCLHWSQGEATGSASTSSGLLDLGYAQSVKAPSNPSCAAELKLARHDIQGTWTAMLDDHAASDSYDKWRAQAKDAAPEKCSA